MGDENPGQKISEGELGKILEADSAAKLVLEGKLNFGQACIDYGRETMIALIYSQQKSEYGGGQRAVSMIRRMGFYDESSF